MYSHFPMSLSIITLQMDFVVHLNTIKMLSLVINAGYEGGNIAEKNTQPAL